MSAYIEEIVKIPTLEAAWQRVYENGGCRGADGVGLQRFASSLQSNLRDLSDSMHTQSYHPYPLMRFPVPKKSE